MSENIKFQKVMVNGMVIKMCRCNATFHIVGRMLHRCKLIDAVSVRKYYDSSRMLSGTSPDSGTSFCNSFNLTATLSLTTFFIIVFHKSICCLICQRTDRSGFECMTLTKENLCIFMSLRLVISGEVQVNIRLFISLETKECFKRNIKSGLNQFFSAHRTISIRHVVTTASSKCPNLFRLKITVMTFFAVIVRT